RPFGNVLGAAAAGAVIAAAVATFAGRFAIGATVAATRVHSALSSGANRRDISV
ncbi:MAG: hypothetical protein HC788_12500, partial [Sphingopyxis sp.]|nr:hypothetical protein [Sphingopyxis sp.]